MATMTQDKNKSANTRGDTTHQHIDEAADKAKHYASNTAEAAHKVADKVQDEAQHAAELAKDGFDHVKDAHASACDKIRKNPTASILIAAGVGLLLGRIFGGR